MGGRREIIDGVVNRIALVGVELEGGWDRIVPGNPFIHDGSVRFDIPNPRYTMDPSGSGLEYLKDYPENKGWPRYKPAEIVSQTMRVTDVEAWMRLAYPEHVNETCGLHAHMSFHNKLNYSRLMSTDFLETIVRELRAWGEREKIEDDRFWQRLDPTHPWTKHHCAHVFLADGQSTVKKKDFSSRGSSRSRYTFLNYCMAQHGTVECRGLPMFRDVETAVKAVQQVFTITNRYLSKIRQRERSVRVQVAASEPVYQEISRIVI